MTCCGCACVKISGRIFRLRIAVVAIGVIALVLFVVAATVDCHLFAFADGNVDAFEDT